LFIIYIIYFFFLLEPDTTIIQPDDPDEHQPMKKETKYKPKVLPLVTICEQNQHKTIINNKSITSLQTQIPISKSNHNNVITHTDDVDDENHFPDGDDDDDDDDDDDEDDDEDEDDEDDDDDDEDDEDDDDDEDEDEDEEEDEHNVDQDESKEINTPRIPSKPIQRSNVSAPRVFQHEGETVYEFTGSDEPDTYDDIDLHEIPLTKSQKMTLKKQLRREKKLQEILDGQIVVGKIRGGEDLLKKNVILNEVNKIKKKKICTY
jgi:cobalamin biosynthesis protein CobT